MRVVDLTAGIAGAYCAKLLTDLGADVVFAAPVDDPLFTYLRTSQRHATDPAPWLAAADLVIVAEPGRAPAGADPLVTVSITAVGHGGPDDGLVSTEEVLQARSGSLANHGHAHLPPLTVAGSLGEYITGAYAALGAVTAWWRASRTEVPEVVDVSMLEVLQMTFGVAPTLMARFPGGFPNRSRWVMIPGNEPTGDGRYVGITTVTTQQWQALARVMGRDDMAEDRELGTMFGRFVRADEVNPALNAWTTSHTADEVVAACVGARVPATIVGNGAELPRFDHLRERNVLVAQPGAAWIRPRAPFRFHGLADRDLAAPGVATGDAWRPRRRDPKPDAVGARPLAGVTVLDFTAFWAGPVATAWLAAMGADVIKVEAVQRPDGIRFSAALRPDQDPLYYEKSVLFHASNLGKRGITLDLGQPDGLDLAKRLVARADVIVENFTPRVLEQFGLDYEVARAIRPDIVMVRMPAFGLTGPWRDRPGFAQTTEQVSGIAWMTGEAGGEALVRSTIDPIAGIHGAFAVFAALEHRDRTGEGQQIEMPMAEVAMNVAAEPIVTWSAYGTLLEREGNRGAPGAPQGVYACSGDEQWVALSVTNDREWRALARVLGDPEWARDPSLATSAGRRARHDEIDAALGGWFAGRERNDAVARLLSAGVLAAPVWDQMIQDELPQLTASGFTQWLDHPVAGRVGYPGTGVRADTFDNSYRAPAPTVGQHTAEVLHELGLEDDEITALHDSGVI